MYLRPITFASRDQLFLMDDDSNEKNKIADQYPEIVKTYLDPT